MFGALKRARPVSPSKRLKCQERTYYTGFGPVIHPLEVATRKSGRESHGDSHVAYLKSHVALPVEVFKGIVFFIRLPVPLHWMDDIRLLPQARATSSYTVCGVSSVIGQNKLICDW